MYQKSEIPIEVKNLPKVPYLFSMLFLFEKQRNDKTDEVAPNKKMVERKNVTIPQPIQCYAIIHQQALFFFLFSFFSSYPIFIMYETETEAKRIEKLFPPAKTQSDPTTKREWKKTPLIRSPKSPKSQKCLLSPRKKFF